MLLDSLYVFLCQKVIAVYCCGQHLHLSPRNNAFISSVSTIITTFLLLCPFSNRLKVIPSPYDLFIQISLNLFYISKFFKLFIWNQYLNAYITHSPSQFLIMILTIYTLLKLHFQNICMIIFHFLIKYVELSQLLFFHIIRLIF